MDFNLTDRQTHWRDRVRDFIEAHVRPAVPTYHAQQNEGERWKVIPVVEELKARAKAEGLWNLFMPPSSGQTPVDETVEFEGPQLTNLEYALCAEEMGRIGWSSEVFNCSAPDTGNMEVFHRYGTAEQKRDWMIPLMEGEIRSAFLMTEPDVASSDATNIQCRIERDGDEYVLNGRKWWSSGAGDPRCEITILMGKTDPSAQRHSQQSMILMPLDAEGVTIERHLPVFGYDDAPHGHMEIAIDDVRVPASNMLLGEGRGFEIAQGRLGPGRIHHCMRTIGVAEEALEKMTVRLMNRVAFGRTIAEYSRLGAAGGGGADQHRDDAAPLPQGRRHDGPGGQQGGPRRDRDDQGRRAAHGARHPGRRDPGVRRRGRHDRRGAGGELCRHPHAAPRRRAGRGPRACHRAHRVRTPWRARRDQGRQGGRDAADGGHAPGGGRRMKAALLTRVGDPLEIAEVETATPGPREVLIRTMACGACRSDLHFIDGGYPTPLPCHAGP